MLWRQLIALLLGMEDLHLKDERKMLVEERLSTGKYIKNRTMGRTYNSESMFTADLDALPNTRNTLRRSQRTGAWESKVERQAGTRHAKHLHPSGCTVLFHSRLVSTTMSYRGGLLAWYKLNHCC